jgi:ubiquinone/menaquinone biosynthesis C-methylase UbiE
MTDYKEFYEKAQQGSMNLEGLAEKHRLLSLDKLIPKGNQELLLDAGCGKGAYSEHFKDKGHKVIGVDISINSLKLAQKIHRIYIYINSTLENLPIKESSIDKILCNDVLEHILDYKQVLEEFKRILKPGGEIILYIPTNHRFSFDWFVSLGYKRKLWVDIETGHINRWNIPKFCAYLESIQLKTTNIIYDKHFFYHLTNFFMNNIWKVYRKIKPKPIQNIISPKSGKKGGKLYLSIIQMIADLDVKLFPNSPLGSWAYIVCRKEDTKDV